MDPEQLGQLPSQMTAPPCVTSQEYIKPPKTSFFTKSLPSATSLCAVKLLSEIAQTAAVVNIDDQKDTSCLLRKRPFRSKNYCTSCFRPEYISSAHNIMQRRNSWNINRFSAQHCKGPMYGNWSAGRVENKEIEDTKARTSEILPLCDRISFNGGLFKHKNLDRRKDMKSGVQKYHF